MFKNKTTKPLGKKKDVQVRQCNLIPMEISPLYDMLLDIRDQLFIFHAFIDSTTP
jgi:hypothetical protein